jgi:hypothetical protein
MSEILRIALVAEGPTDKIVIEAALRAILGGRLFKLQQIFPEESAAFALMGTGWVGCISGAMLRRLGETAGCQTTDCSLEQATTIC